jgi:hypothetical protein
MLDAPTWLIGLRIAVVIFGVVCVALAYNAFRIALTADADLRLKLGKEFSKSREASFWSLFPGASLGVLAITAVLIAYFSSPTV